MCSSEVNNPLQTASQNNSSNCVSSNQCAKIGDYVYFTPCIGKGSFSKVFIGYNINCKTDPPEYLAIKRVNLSDMKKMSIKRIKREINLLKSLNHPNIVKFYDSFTDVASNIYIVTEYCNYGDLSRFTGKKGKKNKLSHDDIKTFFCQFKSGLRYLLTNNILHRDIKPQNVLLHKIGDTVTLKIADFGFAKHFESLSEDSITETLCGTPMYLSPEVLKSKRYTILSDLWSVGIILYELLYHTTPFKRPRNILELNRNVDQMKLSFSSGTNEDLIDLLTSLLQTDPQKRLSWGSFFSHKWFGEEDTSSIEESALVKSCIGTAESVDVLSSSVAGPSKINEPIPDFMQQILDEVHDEQNRHTEAAKSNGKDELDDSTANQCRPIKELYDESMVGNITGILSGSRRRTNSDTLDSIEQSSRLYSSPQFKENYVERPKQSTSAPIELKIKQLYGQPNIGCSSENQSATQSPLSLSSNSPTSPSVLRLPASKPIPMPPNPHRKTSMQWPTSANPPDVARFFNDSLSASLSFINTTLSPLFKS